MGFQFQTDGKRTEEEEDFRQSDHTGAKTSDNEKHLWRGRAGWRGQAAGGSGTGWNVCRKPGWVALQQMIRAYRRIGDHIP